MGGVGGQSTWGALFQPGTQHKTLGLIRGVMEGEPYSDGLVSEVDEWEGQM